MGTYEKGYEVGLKVVSCTGEVYTFVWTPSHWRASDTLKKEATDLPKEGPASSRRLVVLSDPVVTPDPTSPPPQDDSRCRRVGVD